MRKPIVLIVIVSVLIPVLILAVVGVVIVQTGVLDSIFGKPDKGPMVIGRIVTWEETGVLVNYDHQVAFTIDYYTLDCQQATATTKEVVSDYNLASMPDGTLVPIQYNPSNLQDIKLVFGADPEQVNAAMDQYQTGCNAGHGQARTRIVRG